MERDWKVSVEPGITRGGHRRLSIAYKIEFLRLWDQCTMPGDKARLLRANGLTTRTVQPWIRARAEGGFEESRERVVGKRETEAQLRATVARLSAENQRLQAENSQTRAVADILGKAYELLADLSVKSSEPEVPGLLLDAEEYAQWLAKHHL